MFFVAAVKVVGNAAVFPVVFVEVGVQQIEWNPANGQFPNFGKYLTTRKVNDNFQPFTIFVPYRMHRHFGVLLWRVVIDLITVQGNALLKIAVTVQ